MAAPSIPRTAPAGHPHQVAYQAILDEAVAGAELLMVKLVSAAQSSLETRAYAQRDLRLRDDMEQWNKLLRNHESTVCKRFPPALAEAFAAKPEAHKGLAKADLELHFAELELMDEAEVLTSVAVARTQQLALQAADAALADLNSLMSTVLGLGVVKAEVNPLRPENYVQALKTTLAATGAPHQAQLEWINSMGPMLGQELKAKYVEWARRLRSQGIVPAGYAVHQAALVQGVGRGVAQEAWAAAVPPSADYAPGAPHYAPPPVAQGPRTPSGRSAPEGTRREEVLLTLDKLRGLLAGELDIQVPMTHKEHFARQFAHEFEQGAPVSDAPVTDFDSTVPAALVALTEMKQVDHVVQRLERGQAGPSTHAGVVTPVSQMRAQLRANARNLAQVLSLEVVTLMVDNIARDARLLQPVQVLIRDIEPSLLRLSFSDPRFFSDKEHPARQLLQELTDHSLAFDSVQSKGFDAFLQDARKALGDLFHEVNAASDEAYRLALARLRAAWERKAQEGARSHAQAVEVLRHVEARNMLAQKIAKSIEALPEIQDTPSVVVDFLCGPWAQVVAQARLVGDAGSGASDKYQTLISALLWSTHVEMARKNVAKLTRLVPRLLSTMREGLETIKYPATRTSAFFESLMAIHQLAFKAPQEAASALADKKDTAQRSRFVEDGQLWVAPEEAQSSNFVDLAAVPVAEPAQQPVHDLLDNVLPEPASVAEAVDDMPLGTWIEILREGEWVRTQLTWGSPHGTLFLFTNTFGATQSMTRRSRDRLIAAGQLRMVSSQPMVDGALDAVAQTAMRNSVDTTY